MRRTASLAWIVVCVAGLAACRDRDPAADIPVFPALEQLDPDVRRAVEVAADKARERPNAENLGELGRTYHANEFPDLARRCYELAAKLEPERPDWPYYIGRLAADSGESAHAGEMFRATTRLSPGYAPAYYHLGNALLEQGELDAAMRAYSRFVELIPDRAWGYFGLARVARRRDNRQEARELLERAAALPPRVREVSYLLAATYGELGHHEQAEAELLRFPGLPDLAAPADPLIQQVASYSTGAFELLRRAKQHEGRGEFQRAQEIYHQVLRSEPNNYAALANLGNLYKQQGQYDPAEEHLRRAAETQPAQAYAHALLAGIYLDTGRLPQAEAAALAAVERDPQAFNALYYLGRARIGAGRFEEAIEPLRACVELAPQLVEAHFALAVAHAEAGYREAAISGLNDVLRLAPDHGPARAGLAELTREAP